MTKKEKILIVILGAIALLIIGYNAYINAKNKGVDVKVTIDRTVSNDIPNDSIDDSEDINTNENYNEYDEYQKLIDRDKEMSSVDISDRVVDVYSAEEELEIYNNEVNNSDYDAEHIYSDSINSTDTDNENEDDSSQE